ncbi:hypothetical protein Unana1_08724 [Umbelopsis nana]
MLRTPTFRSLQSLATVQKSTAQRTMAIAASKQNDQDGKKLSLSKRLGGGAGRGKPLAADDPFATFLANAQKNAQANPRQANSRPQRPRRTSKPGQFDDAPEAKAKAKAKEGSAADSGRRREKKRNSFTRRQPEQQQRSPLPKASAFVSKDIDWSSFDNVSHLNPVATADAVVTEDERFAQRMEIHGGDYERYLHVQVPLSGNLNAEAIERLVGQNATYSLPEKTTFLATLSSAATGGKAATAKK